MNDYAELLNKYAKVVEERDALRAQIASLQNQLDGYKSGVKEGAEIMRKEIEYWKTKKIGAKDE